MVISSKCLFEEIGQMFLKKKIIQKYIFCYAIRNILQQRISTFLKAKICLQRIMKYFHM